MVNLPGFLKAHSHAGAFNSLLGPTRFIDEHMFLTKAGQLAIVLEAKGLDPECLTDGEMESISKRAANAWRMFDERFRLYQYVVKQDNARIENSGRYGSAAVSRTIAARAAHLEAAGLYTIRLFYVLVIEAAVPARRNPVSTGKLIANLATGLDHARKALHASAEAFERTAGDLIGVRVLPKQEAFRFLRLLVNLDPEISAAESLKHDSHTDYFLPSLLLACSAGGIRIGDRHIEVLSLRQPPVATFPNLLADLLKLEANFILCSEFRRAENQKAVAAIRAAQNHFHWSQWVSDIPSLLSLILNRGKRENVIADKSALDDVSELDQTLMRLNNGGEYLGEFSFTAILHGASDAGVRRAAIHAMKIFGTHDGSLIRETYNALNAFLSIIPGNNAFNVRRGWLFSGNYADLSFLYAPASGDRVNRHLLADHLVVLRTNEHTPFYFNLHEADVLGALVFGAPGSGKSVLANLLIDHSQKHGPRTFILDLGGSYRRITRKHGGTYFEMRFASGRGAFRLNPFCLPPSPENLQFLFTFIRLLLTNGGARPAAADDRELFEAIEGVYVLGWRERTITNLAAGLPPHLKPFLEPWIKSGRYGSMFDNTEDTLAFSHFQTFDFQGMEDYPQVLEPLLFYVFHRITATVCDADLASVYKQLWADEVWRFLANETARQYLVTAGKTWRKHNAGIGLITQSLEDLRGAGVLDLVNEVCPTKILLASPGADLPGYQQVFKLNEKELDLYASLIPKRQFLLKTDRQSKLLNVDLDSEALTEYANSAFQNGRRTGMEVLARN